MDNLVSVDLGGLNHPLHPNWDVFHHIFTTAVHLRHLRLAHIVPFDLPSVPDLYSNSLQVLDIHIESGPFVLSLLRCMVLPSLTEMTVRGLKYRVELLLMCRSLLSKLVRFAIHGDIAFAYLLHDLFTSMPLLQVLDLSCAQYHIFVTYCHWSFVRFRSGGFNLRVLHTPNSSDLRSIREFCIYHDLACLLGLAPHLTFGTPTYVPNLILGGPTAHSLFSFS
ncbi:hypothetical protein C8J57DRAFT_1517902 [Mycena rebaudengoi]|nr:hypothetical protein C8J57DRAFT_1517902 [Mycena rebaudengoi]